MLIIWKIGIHVVIMDVFEDGTFKAALAGSREFYVETDKTFEDFTKCLEKETGKRIADLGEETIITVYDNLGVDKVVSTADKRYIVYHNNSLVYVAEDLSTALNMAVFK